MISWDEWKEFINEYFRAKSQPGNEHKRFGQDFLNKYKDRITVPDPTVFYEPNDIAALDMILEKYVQRADNA